MRDSRAGNPSGMAIASDRLAVGRKRAVTRSKHPAMTWCWSQQRRRKNMDLGLAGKKAIVTGGSKGIGRRDR